MYEIVMQFENISEVESRGFQNKLIFNYFYRSYYNLKLTELYYIMSYRCDYYDLK